jgi:DNA-directed RNA polymerase alpha subunit
MPFRTRDFLLFLLSVGVILIGITSTVVGGISPYEQNAAVIFTETDGDVTYTAAANEVSDINTERTSRLNDLKNKISQLTIGKPTPEPEVLSTPADELSKACRYW